MTGKNINMEVTISEAAARLAIEDLASKLNETPGEGIKSKYHKQIRSESVDVYDVLVAFNVTCPAVAHAVKKLLMPGKRHAKTKVEDLTEAKDSIVRAIEIAKKKGRVEYDNYST